MISSLSNLYIYIYICIYICIYVYVYIYIYYRLVASLQELRRCTWLQVSSAEHLDKFPVTRKFHFIANHEHPILQDSHNTEISLENLIASFPEQGSFTSVQVSRGPEVFPSLPKDLAKWLGLSRTSEGWRWIWGWGCLCQLLRFWHLPSGKGGSWCSWRIQWLLQRLKTWFLTILGSFRLSSSSETESQASSLLPTALSTWTKPTTTSCSFQLSKGFPSLA